MNIQRMLNVFLLIFILINLALYWYIDRIEEDKYYLSREREDLLGDVLNTNNIVLYVELPQFYPRPRLIIFEPEDREKELMESMFEGEVRRPPSYSDDTHIQETVSGRLTFDRSTEVGMIFYKANEVKYKPLVNDEQSKRAIVDEFVSDFTLDIGDFTETDSRPDSEGSSTIYYYNELLEGELLFCNEVLVKLETGVGITEARTIRYEPYEFEEVAYPLLPIDEVIYNLMPTMLDDSQTNKRITAIDIGYYLGTEDRNDLVNLPIEPHYRIKLGSGETHYVNAYTNEVVN